MGYVIRGYHDEKRLYMDTLLTLTEESKKAWVSPTEKSALTLLNYFTRLNPHLKDIKIVRRITESEMKTITNHKAFLQ